MTEADVVSYATTSTVLRPPRLAVLFRADEHWREWAKLALGFVSEAWGGLGFVLVPYAMDGSIEPRVVDAAVAYDPDHIVGMSIHLSDWERIMPGGLGFRGESGEPLDGEARSAMVKQLVE